MTNASTRLICYENARYLRKMGWKVKVGSGDPRQFAITIFQKRYNGRDLARAKRAKGKTILQISEARFMNSARQKEDVIRFAKQVDSVIVGTNRTRKWFKKHGVHSVMIPTGLDFANLPRVEKRMPLKICWIGADRNEKYLHHVVEPINALWSQYKFELRIIGAHMLQARWRCKPNFIKWQLGEAEKRVAECHIGIAPLDHGNIEFSKPPSKLVLYMALGLAVVATETPPYGELIQNGINGFLVRNSQGWYSALEKLLRSSVKRRKIAQRGKESCRDYNAPVIAKRWDKFLRRLI